MSNEIVKQFNIGLSLDTSLHEYINFLHRNKKYIHSIYFSLPLGDKFHTRKIIAKQFESNATRELFWGLLNVIKDTGINIELVLNTYTLTENDIWTAKQLLDSHKISIDSVSILDEYYDVVIKAFPNIPLVYSFNNNSNFHDPKKIDLLAQKYDSCVLGRSFLRDNNVFDAIKKTTTTVILLLNNGCSFNCLTCRKANKCKDIFQYNLKKYDIEYLYSLQSIMPFELYDGTLDLSLIDIFKISNRSSGIAYLQKCLDSYINNSTIEYLKTSKRNFSLWCRLRHISEYCDKFDLKKILKYKEEILGHQVNVK